MSKKSILFICGNINPNSSQGVRYNNILPLLAYEYRLFVISYNKFIDKKNINTIYLKNSSDDYLNNYNTKQKVITQFLKSFYKKYIRPSIFPDKYKFYLKEYQREINILLAKENISTVLIGMTPFSLYELTKYIKTKYSEKKIVVELSDPFSFNVSSQRAILDISVYLGDNIT